MPTNLNKQRILKNEVRKIFRSAKLLQNPVLKAPQHLSPWSPEDPRALKLASVWRSQTALWLAAQSLHRVRRLVPEAHPTLEDVTNALKSPAAFSALARFMGRHFEREPEQLISLLGGITPKTMLMLFGIRSWREIEDVLEHKARDIEFFKVRLEHHTDDPVYKTMGASGQGEQTTRVCAEDVETGEIKCTEVNDDDLFVLLLLVAAGWLIYWIGENLEDWFNAENDDNARKEINISSCDEINSMDDSHWFSQFAAMISGPTGDDDEEAMLKVLDCLPCNRIQKITNMFTGPDYILDEFNGSEWDKLVVRFQQCGLVKFSDWDDDATRLFIKNTPNAKLATLPVNDIVTLCKNLMSGACLDEDEDAIIKLIGSQHPCKVKEIVFNHISINDFDDSVDGQQWDDLIAIIVNALSTVC